MTEIPPDLRAALERKVRQQIECEVRREVRALYEFTLPAISARRVAERNDETELTMSEIRQFVDSIDAAEVQSIEVESFHPAVERFSNCSVALVTTRVLYNQREVADRFRCLWVYSSGEWFTTSLCKIAWSPLATP